MDAKTKKVVIVGSVLVIAGVGGYFGYQYLKNQGILGKKDESDTDTNQALLDAINQLGQNSSGGSSGSSSSSSSSSSSDKPDDILKFQQWVINDVGNKTILGGGGESGFGDDGLWGSKTRKAWNKYKADYLKAEGTVSYTSDDLPVILKGVWKKMKPARQQNSWIKKNKNGTMYIGYKTSVYRYYFFENGQVWIDKIATNTTIGGGNFSNNGKTIAVTKGPRKGDTVTAPYPMEAAYKAVSGAASSTDLTKNPSSHVGKMIMPKGSYVNVRSSAKVDDGFNANKIGRINSPNAVGKITKYALGEESTPKIWYYVGSLTTPLQTPVYTSGWVRSDQVKLA
jgi:hypothetical protein